MLARIAPRFVISRVIQNSHFAEAMCIQLLKQPFGSHKEYFGLIDSKNFYEVNFYGYISSLKKPSQFVSIYQQRAYELATQRFAHFNDVIKLVEKINKLNNELKYLYNLIQRSVTNSNILSRKEQTTDNYEKDIIDAIERFNVLVKNLQNHPQWKNKVVEEIGKWFHMIHNNLAQSQTKRNIFQHLNRQAYFI